METWAWITIAVVAGAAAVLLLALVSVTRKKRRTTHLEERFGSEYHRAVSTSGRKDAERRLSDVEHEHEELDIRPLPSAARERYLEEWRQAEIRFVSDPRDAVRAAERVVVRVLADRGYPADGDTEEQAAHVAVDHPDVAERFRHGHALLDSVDGSESTENLRKAMMDFRAVLDELVGARAAA
jgi:hypothetical protein